MLDKLNIKRPWKTAIKIGYAITSGVLLALLIPKSDYYLLLIIPLFLVLFILVWRNDHDWIVVTHIPRWVNRQAKLISKEFSEKPGMETEKIAYLSSRWCYWKLVIDCKDGQQLVVYRKLKKISQTNKKGAV